MSRCRRSSTRRLERLRAACDGVMVSHSVAALRSGPRLLFAGGPGSGGSWVHWTWRAAALMLPLMLIPRPFRKVHSRWRHGRASRPLSELPVGRRGTPHTPSVRCCVPAGAGRSPTHLGPNRNRRRWSLCSPIIPGWARTRSAPLISLAASDTQISQHEHHPSAQCVALEAHACLAAANSDRALSLRAQLRACLAAPTC